VVVVDGVMFVTTDWSIVEAWMLGPGSYCGPGYELLLRSSGRPSAPQSPGPGRRACWFAPILTFTPARIPARRPDDRSFPCSVRTLVRVRVPRRHSGFPLCPQPNSTRVKRDCVNHPRRRIDLFRAVKRRLTILAGFAIDGASR
jgi:hypothetical protein